MQRTLLACGFSWLVLACGGGGGVETTPPPEDPPAQTGYPQPAFRPWNVLVQPPQVALFFVSGHSFDGYDLPCTSEPPDYLAGSNDAGPYLETHLGNAGYDVRSFHYVDTRADLVIHDCGGWPGGRTVLGFGSLKDDLEFVSRNWGTDTRIVVIAHSHGGLWAHAALRDLDDVLARRSLLLIDLDTNQVDLAVSHVTLGDTCARAGGCTTTIGGTVYDVEDAVWDCVAHDLEVHVKGLVALDHEINERTDGAYDGLWLATSNDTHSTVHHADGIAIPFVADWLVDRLAEMAAGPAAPCSAATHAGSDAPETHVVELGRSSGTFRFDYETYSQEDRIVVTYEGEVLLDTGCVGAQGTRYLSYGGSSTRVTVEVFPNCAGGSGTDWNFTVYCP